MWRLNDQNKCHEIANNSDVNFDTSAPLNEDVAPPSCQEETLLIGSNFVNMAEVIQASEMVFWPSQTTNL